MRCFRALGFTAPFMGLICGLTLVIPTPSLAQLGGRQEGSSTGETRPAIATNSSDQIIERFVWDSYLTTWLDDPVNIRRQFADPVEDYWGRKNVPLSQVVTDKLEYYRKWPRRRYRLLGDSMRITELSDRANVYLIVFDYEFVAENATARSSGIGETELVVKILPRDEIVILSEKGRVLRRD